MARFARWAFCGLVCLGQTTAQELSGPGPCPRARLVPCVLHLHSRRTCLVARLPGDRGAHGEPGQGGGRHAAAAGEPRCAPPVLSGRSPRRAGSAQLAAVVAGCAAGYIEDHRGMCVNITSQARKAPPARLHAPPRA